MITALLSASFFVLGFWARWFFYRRNMRMALAKSYDEGVDDGNYEGFSRGGAIGWNKGREYEVAQQLARRKKRQDARGKFKKIGRKA